MNSSSSQNNPNTSDFKEFKNPFFFNFRGILFVIIILPTIWGIFYSIQTKKWWEILFFIAIGLIWWLYNSWLFYGIRINQEEIIFFNQLGGFKSKSYRWEEIEKVQMERKMRMPMGIRIHTKDKTSKLYPAATLYASQWKEILKFIHAKGIEFKEDHRIKIFGK